MRKLILQMQITIDGFVARPNGALDWMWAGGATDQAIVDKVIELADSCDHILLGRKMTNEFVTYWENVVNNQPDSPEMDLARRMVDMQKIIFSKTEKDIKGRNLRVENGDLAAVINELKALQGKDLMVYGGADFASSLIKEHLVDEFYFFHSPVAIGSGMRIFNGDQMLKLESSTQYKNGKILNKYLPV
ncbi:dihydrofolate reductase family protein [Mucilaginibacter ginkgonis]|uniref:Dihydrofolate reductase family protein n=1 Tax=Mucilaginibacter ginkgonis TaxID=2682091 RepID=A0A6I4I026_9SPHI|nr:dihydrofolate reductase family protein [Mucilaginibacter ginkgonis]QQL48941.1 dihydrofolate reductase family protein [Mucilaginibacter ginkgonis]